MLAFCHMTMVVDLRAIPALELLLSLLMLWWSVLPHTTTHLYTQTAARNKSGVPPLAPVPVIQSMAVSASILLDTGSAMRSSFDQGVTIPSQRRFVQYFQGTVNNMDLSNHPLNQQLMLKKVTISNHPFGGQKGVLSVAGECTHAAAQKCAWHAQPGGSFMNEISPPCFSIFFLPLETALLGRWLTANCRRPITNDQ